MKNLISISLMVSGVMSFTAQATKISDLSNMRAVMAVKQTASGNLCQIDVRGKSSLTPTFLKPASVSTDLIESDISYCDADDTSQLRAQTKNFYLENGYKQKTSTLLVAGIGCLSGAGVAMILYPVGKEVDGTFAPSIEFFSLVTGVAIATGLAVEMLAVALERLYLSSIFSAGVYGAVACANGTTYLLSDELKADI